MTPVWCSYAPDNPNYRSHVNKHQIIIIIIITDLYSAFRSEDAEALEAFNDANRLWKYRSYDTTVILRHYNPKTRCLTKPRTTKNID